MNQSDAKLLHELGERVRTVLHSYFRSPSGLFITFTHLVCRTAVTGKTNSTQYSDNWKRSLMCNQIIHSILTSLLKVKCVILFLFCFFFLNQRIRRAGWTSLTPSTLTTVSSSRKPSSVGRNHQLSHTETSGTEKTSLRGLIINLGSHFLHK